MRNQAKSQTRRRYPKLQIAQPFFPFIFRRCCLSSAENEMSTTVSCSSCLVASICTPITSFEHESKLFSLIKGILINGQFSGPQIDCVTNDNLNISVYNYLDKPFLISWNGIQQRKNSWQDGVFGTTCPIPPEKKFTYILQVKDQISSYYYFPSLGLHKAAGGFGSIKVYSRPLIPVPFPPLAGDHSVLVGDWFKSSHKPPLLSEESNAQQSQSYDIWIYRSG